MNRDEAKSMLLDTLLSLQLISPAERAAATGAGADDILLSGLGIDSMTVVDLCMDIEQKTGRELRVEELIDHPTVDQLAAHLAEAMK
ncbi:MAG: acyl carrier protein [Parvibaculaceae bacterium]